MVFPRRPSTLLRYLVPALLITLTFYLLTEHGSLTPRFGPLVFATAWGRKHQSGAHPIDALIKGADKKFAEKIARSTHTLSDAATAYRKRRGRHPPPGFDKWHEFAQEQNAIIVEDFWDQIYHDLEPFWGLRPAQIRKNAREFEMRIEVRDHKASSGSDWFWTKIWLEMIQKVEHILPDMDLALNAMDEPRMVVPWEDIEGYMKKAEEARKIVDVKYVVSEFAKLPPLGEAPMEHVDSPPVEWEHHKHYWLIARRGCPPDSPARQADILTDFDRPPTIASPFTLAHMQEGYVANYSLSTDFCHQPDLQGLEGVFVEPLSVSATKSLLPVFGGSKLSANNEILLPAPMYWKEEERFTGAEGASIPWSAKDPTAIWRGVATGGLNHATNWRAFQRHRFVAMNNASLVALAESDPAAHPPPNFALPAAGYPLARARAPPSTLGDWLAPRVNISFTDLMCSHEGFFPGCDYTNAFFTPSPPLPMAEQFRHKYLPDVDGNSFSGRYLGFLRSTSVPVKASLWREWHDARLVPWKHFVPMDSRFGDWWGILEYFLGEEGEKAAERDRVAEGIAMAGREWAGKVLRKEDMLVYVLRLLLEYARVVDDRREVMGWVGDLR